MDPYKKMGISLNPDGSLTRHDTIPVTPLTGDNDSSAAVLSRDAALNATHNTWLRIFLPNNLKPSSSDKLPVILDFHGGGFVLYSAASSFLHNSCEQLSAGLPAIVLSVEYRLAPEHRLPAAYEDAADALLWVRDQARSATDPWMKAHADFDRCFLMGSSSGGNIAYRLGLRALELDLEPLKLCGLVMNQPFFGGEERTESEVKMRDDKILPLAAADLMWELALPPGAGRDHEFSNPMLAAGDERPRGIGGLPRCLVRGYAGDPLVDRQKVFVKMLEEEGVRVVARFADGFHGVELFDPAKAEGMVDDVRRFVYDCAVVGGCGGGAPVNRL